MCARYTLRKHLAQVAEVLAAQLFPGLEAQPLRYNIAPTQRVPVVAVDESGRRVLRLMRWGLVPYWAKDLSIGAKLINARAETLAEKPAFRDAVRHRRCLIPADGFYEWTGSTGGSRQPYFIHRRDEGVLALAGLWEHWQDAVANELETCTVITTPANTVVRGLHDRMPAILPPQQWQAWLAPDTPLKELAPLLRPAGDDLLAVYPVSRGVNRPTFDDPSCVQPIQEEVRRPTGLFG